MARLRVWLSRFLVAILLLTAAPVHAEEAGTEAAGGQPETVSGQAAEGAGLAAGEPDGSVLSAVYVRIQNKWQSNFLYEASDGTVRYGMTSPGDETSHWQLQDDADGTTRIQNRKTGHYITIENVSQRRDALTASEADESTPETRWRIEDASRAGYSLIKSATVPSSGNLVIHEEDQLGFAEASTDINVTFESPQWKLAPISDPIPVRIRNQERAGQYLYATTNPDAPERTADVVAFGKLDAGSASYIWLMESGEDGTVKLRNQSTGQYIVQFGADDYWRKIETGTPDNGTEAEWTVAAAMNLSDAADAGYVTFQSAVNPAYVLNSQFPDDSFARSNDWSNAKLANAHWRIEPVGETPVRIVNFTEADVGTDYLYEDGGVVKHGALDAANAYNPLYQWVVEDYDAAKRIRNAATGHYVTAGSPLTAVDPAVADSSAEWSLRASEQYDDYVTIGSVANVGEYVNLAGGESSAAAIESSAVDPLSNGAQWLLEDPAVPAGTNPYVRIQNVWQPYVLYEDDNGDLKYGNPRSDQRDQWQIQKYHGRKRIQNRATGHYINLEAMNEGHVRVTDVEDDWTSAVWVIETVSGAKLIRSVDDPATGGETDRLINLQNLTKYAEYAAINRGWGSPRWTFVTVSDDLPAYARLINKQTGKPLYEEVDSANDEQGTVKYGDRDVSDRSSVWAIEDAGDGSIRLQNAATGNYVAMENVGGDVELADPPQPLQTLKTIYPVWGSAKWFLENATDAGYVSLRSAWASHYIRADESGGGMKVSKSVKAGDGTIAASAEYKLEAVDAASPEWPQGYIQLRSAYNGQSLYENKSGVVLYGDVASSNGYSHWLLETTDGQTRIKNRVTGHYLAVNGDYRYLESIAADSANSKTHWALESASSDGSSLRIRSLYGSMNDEYVHVDHSLGYAERGLLPVSYGSLVWQLAAAPSEFEIPADSAVRNDQTATPVQDDTGYVAISSGGKRLTGADGTVALTEAEGASSQWLLQDFNGRKLIKNRESGELLAVSASGKLETTAAALQIIEATQWIVEDTLGYRTVRSAANPSLYLSSEAGSVKLGASAASWAFEPMAADVVYEAEEAFASGQVDAGSGTYAEGFASAGNKLVWAVNAQAAGDYEAKLRYRSAADSAKSLGLYVNGERVQTLSLPGAEEWTELPLALALRAGINSVTLESDAADAAVVRIDSLTVMDSVAKAYRGATLPYITYEAEQGATNGELIGPSRVYREVASEASGRQAVKLSDTGDYVEFRTAKDANSIVLRYSIPDSEDGQGLNGTLGLYVNGEFRQKLALTSKYAWEYGSYPWSNDPKQGSGHRFFDEIHALVGDIPAGSTVRLEKDADSNADYYIVDLADLEQVAEPFAKPEGFVSVTDYGAVANDGLDDTAAFREAMEENDKIWFPAGEFELGDGLLYLDRVTIRGAGMWHTQLNGAKFVGKGDNIQVYDLLIDGGINERDDEAITNAFHGGFGPGSVIQNVWIEHTKAGLWLTKLKDSDEYTHGLYMLGLRIRNLMADGINFCVGTADSLMEQSDIRYPGDDGIAIWSAEGRASIGNAARFNNVSLPWLADNIVVFGGTDNKVQDNIVSDTITNGAGIAVSTRFNPVPFDGTTIVERNTMIRTGSYDTGYQRDLGALWVFASDKDMSGKIVIRDNVALDSTYLGVAVQGDFALQNVTIGNLVVDGAGTQGVEVASTVKGALKVDNVIIRGARIADVSNASSSLVISKLGRGLSSLAIPFELHVGGTSASAASGVSLKVGEQAAVRVVHRTAGDVTSEAELTLVSDTAATLSEGNRLSGRQIGSTYLLVSVLGETRAYPVTVTAATPGGGGTGTAGSGTGQEAGGSADANDRKLLEAKEGQIAFDAAELGANGIVPFSVKGLLAAIQANPQGVIVVSNGSASYSLPLSVIAELLKDRSIADPANAVWSFVVRPADAATAARAKAAAAVRGIELAGEPTEFSLQLEIGGVREEIGSFGSTYVKRTLEVAGDLESTASTVLVFDPETGSFRFVPATFASSGGKTTATIVSPTNSLYVVAKSEKTYADIASHWAKKDIELLAGKLIVNGVSGTEFAPNRGITRAEFASLLVRSFGLKHEAGAAARTFKDVAASAWYAEEVAVAAEYGFVQGLSDGSFRPNDGITREQMAVMIARALAFARAGGASGAGEQASVSGGAASGAGEQALATFADSGAISGWAREAVVSAVGAGILQGTEDGRFAPAAEASRAEAATMLKRLLQAVGFID
ncbi:S-layer homology domain-containing protein [Cohnella fermenti]|uniref:Carbohydrate-binding protein n=1 Tax=Cohnella fermenti TaxID=2565925 RepID=A0A4S4BSR4_9BACL|nr:RICIN domain-containing protein [Cohnella fermenti]THF77291.1 hypothetical protein E6C55_16630 [Cohnella fermenti]